MITFGIVSWPASSTFETNKNYVPSVLINSQKQLLRLFTIAYDSSSLNEDKIPTV